MKDARHLIVHQESSFPALVRSQLNILQVNLGYLCNLSCVHCHVNAGPTRTEQMEIDNIDLIIEVLKKQEIEILDLTGGAPEMNQHFKYLVKAASELGVKVIDRCNLAILNEEGYEDLTDFLAQQKVIVVASLPCYSQENVDQQRGKGAFESSITALKKLNAVGFGREESLTLDLVYNPQGAALPPPQETLQDDYKKILKENFDIDFNSLLTITNMPISRFGAVLMAHNQYDDYMTLLKDSFSQANLSSVMCRNLVSVDWLGNLYDCDFNQMLGIHARGSKSSNDNSPRLHLKDLLNLNIEKNSIQVADHCFGCTAGQGSSCSGAL
jgi:radical SAM/Cys-rich protein